MLRSYDKTQRSTAAMHSNNHRTFTRKATKMWMLLLVGVIVVFVGVNVLEAGGIFLDLLSPSVRRTLCEGDHRQGVLTMKLSSYLWSEQSRRRILCDWDTPLEDESYRNVFEANTTYDTHDPLVEYPDTTLAFVVTIPYCPDSGDEDDPGEAFYDAAAVLKDSICNNTRSDTSSSDSQYNATMYAIIHPNAVFCTGPTPQNNGGSSTTSRRALSSSSSDYEHDRVKILQELGFWVVIAGEPNVSSTSRDLMPLYAYNLTQHSVVVMMKFDTVIVGECHSSSMLVWFSAFFVCCFLL